MKNMAFHSFTQMEDDYTANSHRITYTFIFERLEECTLWTRSGSERVKRRSCKGIYPPSYFLSIPDMLAGGLSICLMAWMTGVKSQDSRCPGDTIVVGMMDLPPYTNGTTKPSIHRGLISDFFETIFEECFGEFLKMEFKVQLASCLVLKQYVFVSKMVNLARITSLFYTLYHNSNIIHQRINLHTSLLASLLATAYGYGFALKYALTCRRTDRTRKIHELFYGIGESSRVMSFV